MLNPTHLIKNFNFFFSTQYQNIFGESQTEHETTNLRTDDLVTILTFPQLQHKILTWRDESGAAQESLTYRGPEVCKDALLPPVTHSLPDGQQRLLGASSALLPNICRIEGPWMTDLAFPWTSGVAKSLDDEKTTPLCADR